MPEVYGTQELEEVLTASGDLAVLFYRAQKDARKPDGSLDFQKLGQAIVAQVMTHPEVIENIKEAVEGIHDVPKEIRDLDLIEALRIVSFAGAVASKCAAEIKE
jgi:hypothetical protein